MKKENIPTIKVMLGFLIGIAVGHVASGYFYGYSPLHIISNVAASSLGAIITFLILRLITYRR